MFSISFRVQQTKNGLELRQSQSLAGLLIVQARHCTQGLSDISKVLSLGDTDAMDVDSHTCIMSKTH